MLAEKAELHVNVIKKLEKGPKEGSPESREKIAAAFGCTITDLFSDTIISNVSDAKDRLELIDRIMKMETRAIQSLLRTTKELIGKESKARQAK